MNRSSQYNPITDKTKNPELRNESNQSLNNHQLSLQTYTMNGREKFEQKDEPYHSLSLHQLSPSYSITKGTTTPDLRDESNQSPSKCKLYLSKEESQYNRSMIPLSQCNPITSETTTSNLRNESIQSSSKNQQSLNKPTVSGKEKFKQKVEPDYIHSNHQLSLCNPITKQITTPNLRDESNQTSSKHKLSLKKQTTKAQGIEKLGIEDNTGHNPPATLHQPP